MSNARIILIDNRDSFVYNLVDAFATTGRECTVFRNNVDPSTVLEDHPDVICLSPGPGHPTEAGNLMAILDAALRASGPHNQGIPVLGICLGFQALLEHYGGHVAPCGAVHGIAENMTLTSAGSSHPIFEGLTLDRDPEHPEKPGQLVPVARYHSLGCTNPPAGLENLATIDTPHGAVSMAAETVQRQGPGHALGLQFHPESVLSPSGPLILQRSIDYLLRTHQS
ncbi:anthranilate synthase component II [Corynebacterium sp. 3HC-13]|uniref:glutamine amidotransferase-related protein n=1 Tax=Corynebacterium poyangense TaxID=2684405 RepID=UPI001CCFBD0B|nr:gamma-glutamyl-gamma-aminobutyrate hydrolase family protein [Corynebacterium poyangense]MBZ8177255.1 anthranilate synthase component II [Corynebacterium poyangense]